jgi:hypothetical protein
MEADTECRFCDIIVCIGMVVTESIPFSQTLTDGFLDEGLALRLRALFDKRFENPRSTESHRFVWDYWYVKDQVCVKPIS